jgi:predicted enzyme related to lactoylglutathione lyase
MALATLRDICFDCRDARRLAGFWAEVLGYRLEPPEPGESDESVPLFPSEGGLRMWFNQVPETKSVKNRVHIDVNLADETGLQRLLDLGAQVIGEIRGDDGELWWTVVEDPEGNEFCAFPPRG